MNEYNYLNHHHCNYKLFLEYFSAEPDKYGNRYHQDNELLTFTLFFYTFVVVKFQQKQINNNSLCCIQKEA